MKRERKEERRVVGGGNVERQRESRGSFRSREKARSSEDSEEEKEESKKYREAVVSRDVEIFSPHTSPGTPTPT